MSKDRAPGRIPSRRARWFSFLDPLLLALFAGGCASMQARTLEEYPRYATYPGVMNFPRIVEQRWEASTADDHGSPFAERALWLAASVVDAPLTLAFDTFLLPLDLVAWLDSRRGSRWEPDRGPPPVTLFSTG